MRPKCSRRSSSTVDRDRRPGAFWLTGSQQFAVMKGITETLAGRVAILTLLGFTQRETDGRPAGLPPFLPDEAALQARSTTAAALTLHDVYERIWRGSMPALVTGQIRDRDLFYRSYVQTYLERDVRDLTQVGDLNAFGRFLRAVAARTAQMLNYSDLARDCAISVNTARKWMSVLEGSFQVAILPAYHTNLSKRLYSTPKLHFLDTGLCAYLTEWSSPETLEAGAMSGALFESFVFGEILKSWHNRGRRPAFHYYRDKDGREIDLLISHDGRSVAHRDQEGGLGAGNRHGGVSNAGGAGDQDRPRGRRLSQRGADAVEPGGGCDPGGMGVKREGLKRRCCRSRHRPSAGCSGRSVARGRPRSSPESRRPSDARGRGWRLTASAARGEWASCAFLLWCRPSGHDSAACGSPC